MSEQKNRNSNGSWFSSGSAEEIRKLPHLAIWGKKSREGAVLPLQGGSSAESIQEDALAVPGNSSRHKAAVIDLKRPLIHTAFTDLVAYILTLKTQKLGKKQKRRIDNFVWYHVRPDDDSFRDTFTDIPYLIPFPAEGSDRAVIVVPGGGYCSKSMDSEGIQIAQALQAKGITAFVLWYRSSPYPMPYPLMDLQRAIRYARYHAADYGYSPDKVGAIGFSAGGAQVAWEMNVLSPGLIELPAYPHDAIDAESDRLNFMAPVYPALSYHYNLTMLYATFPKEVVEDKEKREKILETYDAIAGFCCRDIPHFICYGTKDDMVSLPEIHQYINLLKESNTSCKVVAVDGAGHGFGAAAGKKEGFWLGEFTDWVSQLPL